MYIFSLSACDSNNNSGESQTLREFLEQDFRQNDQDGDGVINLDDALLSVQDDFNDMDQDSDGVITAEDHVGQEYLGDPVTKEERAELVCDANDDETLTQAEYTDCTRTNILDVMDTDDNDMFTMEEMMAFHNAP